MFVITQFIGLGVLKIDPFHIKTEVNGQIQLIENPWLSFVQPPVIQQQSDFGMYFSSMIVSFVIAIVILFLFTKYKVANLMKIWFFLVVAMALFITLNIFPALIFFPNLTYFEVPVLIFALSLSFFKTFKRNIIVHNVTELFIYPGIATVFVPILNLWSISVLLIVISVYDMWAVWHSGIMQKMAAYQINDLKVFGGFFIPYISKEMRNKLKKMKKSKLKGKKIRANVALLGGGDIFFALVAAGVMFKVTGSLIPALFITAGATLGLGLLLVFSEKKKSYPAMPFISAGIFLGMLLSYLIFI